MRDQSSVSKLLCVLATAVAGITACAAPAESPVDEIAINALTDEIQINQIPVDTSKPTGITFSYNGLPFVQVLATGDGLSPKSTFAARTEYWAGSRAISLRDVSRLQMVSSEVRPEDAALKKFLYPSTSFGTALTAPQVVSKADWTPGIYAPDTMQASLFKASDPDDAHRSIGLLLEQDARGRLVAATWYKSVNTSRIFERTPEALTFEHVTDARGRPSTDPRHIDPESKWFYFTAR